MPRGHVIAFDFSYATSSSNKAVAEAIFILMRRAIEEKSKIQIVHKQLVLLPVEGSNSPLGFTSVLLLDESHFTCHCYAPIATERGLMSVDIFTCGQTELMPIIRFLQDGISHILNNVVVHRITESARF